MKNTKNKKMVSLTEQMTQKADNRRAITAKLNKVYAHTSSRLGPKLKELQSKAISHNELKSL